MVHPSGSGCSGRGSWEFVSLSAARFSLLPSAKSRLEKAHPVRVPVAAARTGDRHFSILPSFCDGFLRLPLCPLTDLESGHKPKPCTALRESEIVPYYTFYIRCSVICYMYYAIYVIMIHRMYIYLTFKSFLLCFLQMCLLCFCQPTLSVRIFWF